MKKHLTTLTIAFCITALAAVAVGCGSSSTSSSTTTSTQTGTAAGSNVAIALTEMKIAATPSSAKAGEVTFDVKNQGALAHEMVVIKTTKQASQLGSGSTVPETGAVGETGDVPAGGSKTLKLKLTAGHYALICNIAGHYAAGMYTDFNVS